VDFLRFGVGVGPALFVRPWVPQGNSNTEWGGTATLRTDVLFGHFGVRLGGEFQSGTRTVLVGTLGLLIDF
jgi:hypothetical protein